MTAIANAAAEHLTYETRLASFQNAQPLSKRRTSSANSKAPKSAKWPHKFMSPQDLAKAGFFFHPLQSNPDNVVCFLCHRALDGWEDGDDPLSEHLKHSPDCGWAIVTMIETQDGELSEEYPLGARMVEARKATFLDKWPHDSKKGWKCKTKQMVEAGWKYTPTPEYDDMATCTYCWLALDGWEPADKPMDEHYKRSPDCPFFSLISNHKQNLKQPKAKRDRTSKASRLSTQSAFPTLEDQSIVDLAAEEGDSILTTATTATSTGRKMVKAKKALVTKGKKTRTKKEEPVEVHEEAPEPEDADFEVKIDPAPKPSRGRKRKSDQLNQSTMSMIQVEIEAPPPKRRATRTRGSVAIDDSMVSNDARAEAPKAKGRKVRASRAKKNSTASVLPMDVDIPDDDEIDKALEADLDRPLSDEEILIPPPKQKKATRGSRVPNADHAMFGMEAAHIDEAEIEAELELMEVVELKALPKAKGAPKGKTTRKPSAKQAAAAKKVAEHEAAEAEAQARAVQEEEEQRHAEEELSLQIVAELENSISMLHSSPIIQPKKQRASSKPKPRPAPTRATRGSVMSVDDHAEERRDESGNETDASMASQSTVVRGGGARRGSNLKKSKGGKKAASRNIEVIIQRKPSLMDQEEEVSHARKGKKAMPLQEISILDENLHTPSPEVELEPENALTDEMDEDEAELEQEEVTPPDPSSPLAAKTQSRPQIQQTLTAMMEHMDETHAVASSKSKTAKGKSPMPPPRSPTPPPREDTPSQSPQSSDAENHPPSSRPSTTTKKTPTPLSAAPRSTYASTPRTTTTRIPLASTPILSPSKRNVVAGLQSSEPWTAVDLDTIFAKSPAGQLAGFGEVVAKAKDGGLSSPEKKMTVEEWILHNATLAEEKLRAECEGMVGAFEQQGGRAMRALECVE